MRAGVVVIVPLCCSCSAAAYRPEVAHKAAGDGFELAVTRLRITSMGEGIPPPGRGNGVQVTVTPKTTSPIMLGPPRMVLGGGAACSDGIEARTPGSGNPLAPAVSLGVADSERDLDYVFARQDLEARGWPDREPLRLDFPWAAQGPPNRCLQVPVIESVQRVEWSYHPSLSVEIAPMGFRAVGSGRVLDWGWLLAGGVGTWLGPVLARADLGVGKAYERDDVPGSHGSFTVALLGASADIIAVRLGRFGIAPELGYDALWASDRLAYHGPRAALRLGYLPPMLPSPPFQMRPDAWSIALVPSFFLWSGGDRVTPGFGLALSGDIGF